MNYTLQERAIAALTYLFELGYFLTWFLKTNDKSSEFLDFHLKQTNRIIKMVWIPAIACVLIALASPKLVFMIWVAFVLFIVALFFDIRGAYYAYKGQTKKVI